MTIEKKGWFFPYLIIFIFLSLSSLAINAGIKMRLNQVLVLLLFAAVFIDDVTKKKIDIKSLAVLYIGGIIMTLISLNSIHDKIGEIKFIIKYILIFPAAFYLGVRAFEKLSAKNLIKIIEITAFTYAFMAFIFYFYPLPIFSTLASTAGEEGILSTYRGTFSETGWFAVVVGAFLLASISLRYDFKIWPKNKIWLNLFYIFLLYSIAMSKNKTVWIAFVFIGVCFILYKIVANLILSNHYKPKYIQDNNPTLKFFSNIKIGRIVLFIVMFLIVFFTINEFLERPIVSWAMIDLKIEQERGKAFGIIMELIRQSNWIGGYGFGFVELYFSNYSGKILGLGEGVGMLFNSYLDSWISVSIFGLIFHMTLLYISFGLRYYFTMAIPIYFFVFANFNPATGSEYYYIFLGLSYGAIIYHKNSIDK